MHERESSNYRPGEPLRAWTDVGDDAWHEASLLIIKAARASTAVRKLVAGQPLTDADLIACGRLNSHCVLSWFEPITMLIREPLLDPVVAKLFEDPDTLPADR